MADRCDHLIRREETKNSGRMAHITVICHDCGEELARHNRMLVGKHQEKPPFRYVDWQGNEIPEPEKPVRKNMPVKAPPPMKFGQNLKTSRQIALERAEEDERRRRKEMAQAKDDYMRQAQQRQSKEDSYYERQAKLLQQEAMAQMVRQMEQSMRYGGAPVKDFYGESMGGLMGGDSWGKDWGGMGSRGEGDYLPIRGDALFWDEAEGRFRKEQNFREVPKGGLGSKGEWQWDGNQAELKDGLSVFEIVQALVELFDLAQKLAAENHVKESDRLWHEVRRLAGENELEWRVEENHGSGPPFIIHIQRAPKQLPPPEPEPEEPKVDVDAYAEAFMRHWNDLSESDRTTAERFVIDRAHAA